jgi:hypothetical protein
MRHAILRALHAVLVQDYPADPGEIFVVDGMAEDGMRDIVPAIAVREPRVQLVDGHAVIAPDYLRGT